MSGAQEKTAGRWGDLPARMASAVVMLLVGGVAIWQGGVLFHELVVLICGVMVWELTRMMNGGEMRGAVLMGVIASGAMFATHFLPGMVLAPVLAAVGFAGASQIKKDRLIYGAYAIGLMFACYGLIVLRDVRGAYWLIWLVSVVVATDVAGYFAGRILGGPKFWPKVSPKKTWSGTVAGWVAAALVGMAFGGTALIVISILTSFASQMGDAAESAIKRRTGIKDSSNLIPGHGGLLDRFDAMMGAALLVLLMGAVLGLPAT